MTVLLESAFLTTAYMVTKKCDVDRSIKSILIFNIFATVCVPILLYLMKNPIKNAFVNKEAILNTINSDGVFSLLHDVNAYGFLLYQAIGIIILLGFCNSAGFYIGFGILLLVISFLFVSGILASILK